MFSSLEAMMQRHPKWDDRFFFSRWNQALIDKLLCQQEALKKKNIERHVLIMCDDVILTGKDIDQLAHMACEDVTLTSHSLCVQSHILASVRERVAVWMCYFVTAAQCKATVKYWRGSTVQITIPLTMS